MFGTTMSNRDDLSMSCGELINGGKFASNLNLLCDDLSFSRAINLFENLLETTILGSFP